MLYLMWPQTWGKGFVTSTFQSWRGPWQRLQNVDDGSKVLGLRNGPQTWGAETGCQTWGREMRPQGRWCTFINEPGFYELVFSSKLETAKKFRQWVFTTVLPSIRKYGQYKLHDNPYNKMIMIGNETDVHYKVVDMIRRFHPDIILVAGLGENQDTEDKRLDSYKKGYIKGRPDLLVLNYHKDFKGLGIEFKSPTGNYYISKAQKEMKKRYVNNGYAYILCNDYDNICKAVHEYILKA